MKYLNTYKLFESNDNVDDVEQHVKDILQDLSDDGFNVDVNNYKLRSDAQLHVFINKVNMDDDFNNSISASKFIYSDIKEPVDHLMSFLKESGYRLEYPHVSLNYTPVYFSFDTVKDSDEMGRFELRFIKTK